MSKSTVKSLPKFTEKQKRFIQCYDGNATKAALKAGYSKKTAYSSGQRLLKDVEISVAIKKRMVKKVDKIIATREDRQKFWTKVMNGRFKVCDRLRASDLLGKSEADFTMKHEVGGKDEGPILIDTKIISDEQLAKLIADELKK